MTADGDTHSPARAERRHAERLEILGDLRGSIMVYQPMVVRELGFAGAQIETAYPLHINSLHELRLELDDASVVVRGRVVHSSIEHMDRDVVSYRSGLEFMELSAGVRAVIERFVEAMRDGRLAR